MLRFFMSVEHLLGRHAVGVRCLEDPLLDRLDDHHAAGQRNEGHARLLDQRRHRHGRAGGGAADDQVDLVRLDQALGEAVGLARLAAVVVVDQLELAAQHAALRR